MSGKTPAEEAADLREATRGMHAAIKDGRALMREMVETEARLRKTAEEVFEERMMAQVKEGLDAYSASMADNIEKATQAVFKRFDTIADKLLGEDRQNRRSGRPSIGELVDRAATGRRESPFT